MIARRSVWGDDKVQALLAEFVTVADEVGRLQRGGDAECELFKGFCEEGHYGHRAQPTSTRQGIYAVAPSGKFLASCNTSDPARMAKMLQEAMVAWKQLPESERHLGDEQVKQLEATHRFEDKYPTDGLVLAEYLRDLEVVAVNDDRLAKSWNEDQAWFRKAEVLAMVPAAPDVGAKVEWPRPLLERLARLHLIDSVRGQTFAYPREAVLEAHLESEVVGIEGGLLQLRLRGHSRTEQKGQWAVEDSGQPVAHARGVEVEFTGHATWNAQTARFEAFELLAIGERFGATQYNRRVATSTPAAIGFAFVLAPADHPRVAPAFWWDYGW